jgi:hypothetical protein
VSGGILVINECTFAAAPTLVALQKLDGVPEWLENMQVHMKSLRTQILFLSSVMQQNEADSTAGKPN